MIEGIIWDFDDTLISSMPLHYKCYKQVLSELNLDFTEELFYKSIGGTAIEVIPKLIGNRYCSISIKEIHERKKIYLMKILDNIDIKPLETAKLLPVLYGKYKMAIGSSGSKVFIDKVLSKLDWAYYFDTIVSSEDVKCGKPSPEIFLTAAKRMQIEPENCIVFEDQRDGIQAAMNARMQYFDVNKLK